MRIEPVQTFGGVFYLRFPDLIGAVENLPLQVACGNTVGIEKDKTPHAGGAQQLRECGTQPAGAHQQYAGLGKTPLRLGTEAGQQQLARIAFFKFGRKEGLHTVVNAVNVPK